MCKLKKWAEIGRDLGYSGKIMSSLSTSLKNSFQRWLHPYEEYLRVAKPGVQQQLEFEHGGPYTPSPKPSPMDKKSQSNHQTPSNAPSESPVIRASAALNASVSDETPEKSATPVEAPPPPQPTTSGFTAVNSNAGGFSAINAPSSSFVAVNDTKVKREGENGALTPKSASEHPEATPKNSSDRRKSGRDSTPMVNGNGSHPLKRAISHESASQGENGEDDGANGRRSKRLKKGTPPKCG